MKCCGLVTMFNVVGNVVLESEQSRVYTDYYCKVNLIMVIKNIVYVIYQLSFVSTLFSRDEMR